MRLVLVVAAALFDDSGRILITQRPEGKAMAGLWEFPGGKVEPGERPEDALVRELSEELSLTVAPQDLAPFTFASHGYNDFHLLMPLYICRTWRGEPQRSSAVAALRFVSPADLCADDMPAADGPLVTALQAHS
ncbi:MAG: (deoxy)nucleoside triphosphate pyrophosphohydrolase [Pseudomonadota bacterium]